MPEPQQDFGRERQDAGFGAFPPYSASGSEEFMTEQSQLFRLHSVLRRELRQHQLTEREHLVAEMILDFSYGWGLKAVRIADLDDFTRLTGIGQSDVRRILGNLELMRFVSRRDSRGLVVYIVEPDPNKWKCRVRVSELTIRDATARIRALNGLALPADELASPLEEFHDGWCDNAACPGSKDLGGCVPMTPVDTVPATASS
jgi:hypothetical protein